MDGLKFQNRLAFGWVFSGVWEDENAGDPEYFTATFPRHNMLYPGFRHMASYDDLAYLYTLKRV